MPILVGLCVSTVPVHAQVAAGNVTSLIGTASIQRAGSSIDVPVGMPVQVPDQVVVSEGGKVTITLSDGSLLEVGSSSTIVIDEELLGPAARASRPEFTCSPESCVRLPGILQRALCRTSRCIHPTPSSRRAEPPLTRNTLGVRDASGSETPRSSPMSELSRGRSARETQLAVRRSRFRPATKPLSRESRFPLHLDRSTSQAFRGGELRGSPQPSRGRR